MTAKRTHHLRRTLEGLEDRALMATGITAFLNGGTLNVIGTERPDRISVIEQNGRIWVADDTTYARIGNSGTTSLNVESKFVGSVAIYANGGNDVVNLTTSLGTLTKPADLWGGEGSDTMLGG